MHAGLLDVLHHAADDDLAGAVAQRVDVDLDRVFEEAVDERGPFRRQAALASEAPAVVELAPSRAGGRRRRRRSPSRARRARTTAARAPGSRSSLRDPRRASSTVVAMPPGGCGMPSRVAQRVELLAVFGRGRSTAGCVPSTGMPGAFERVRELQRRLAAERDDHARGRSPPPCRRVARALAHVEHVLVGERFEEEAVARVVVGRDRLGVAVDHHGLVARRRAARTRRARSSSRTRRPGRCGSGRCRGSRPPAWSSGATSSSSS